MPYRPNVAIVKSRFEPSRFSTCMYLVPLLFSIDRFTDPSGKRPASEEKRKKEQEQQELPVISGEVLPRGESV